LTIIKIKIILTRLWTF